jgi:broad specificity phosphatase PhoE
MPGTTIVVLVRHAERAAGDDPGLTPGGVARATLLAAMLRDVNITRVFVSDARRTHETAAPLAAATGLVPQVHSEPDASTRSRLGPAGSRVLIIGHTNTVPAFIEALGGPSGVRIGESEFDRFLVLTLPTSGTPSLLTLRYPPIAATP